jgi:hypothetical protein
MSQKEEDFKGYLDGYNESFNSELWVGIRDIVKDVPGLSEGEMKMSQNELEKQYIPSNISIYNIKGEMYGLVFLIIFLLMNSNSSTSYF